MDAENKKVHDLHALKIYKREKLFLQNLNFVGLFMIVQTVHFIKKSIVCLVDFFILPLV